MNFNECTHANGVLDDPSNITDGSAQPELHLDRRSFFAGSLNRYVGKRMEGGSPCIPLPADLSSDWTVFTDAGSVKVGPRWAFHTQSSVWISHHPTPWSLPVWFGRQPPERFCPFSSLRLEARLLVAP